jgi:hypothetical protein
MIGREEVRLRSLFHRLLLLSAAASPVACSTAENAAPTDASTTTDSTLPSGSDAAGTVDAGASSDTGAGPGDSATAPMDAGVDALDPFGFLDSACDPQYVDAAIDAADATCQFYASLPCGIPPNSATEGCYLSVDQCGVLCNQAPTLARVCAVSECLVVDASSIPSTTPLTLECATGVFSCGPGIGRRPEGLAATTPARGVDRVGALLAEMAHLEAASVHAFRRLGDELTAKGAPRALVRCAERSARDEVRHARVTSRLARRRGAKPPPVVVARRPRGSRSLVDFAIENAVEGCVRESFGALVATRQARAARDPRVARAMARIAVDETRHAALAWEIARWLRPRLEAGERARVTRAMRGAIASLRCEVSATPSDVAGELGLPTGPEAARLVDAFGAECMATVLAA